MKNNHDAHHSNDGWTFEENNLFEDAAVEFDNASDDMNEKNGGKRKHEETAIWPRAGVIPWKEEEHR